MNNLNKLDIKSALEGLKNKDFSSIDLVRSCLSRISAVEDKLHSFVSIWEEEALKEAHQKDELIKQGSGAFKGLPLLGIPISIKDNFNIKGSITTASSNLLKYYKSQYDSTVARKLLDAGAIILGKNNMDAWAHGTSTETSDFFTTLNPWDRNKLPGGSSGGSAAAVAADEVIASVGTETAGSIRIPASWCGVVGLKPTYGRVSRYGVIAMGSSLDSPGPITKTVWDSAYMLSIMAGEDGYDATASSKSVDDYSSKLTFKKKDIKVALPKEYYDLADEDTKGAIKKTVALIESEGIKVSEISLFDPEYAIDVYTIIQRSEVSSNLGRYDGIRYGDKRSSFGQEAKRRIMLGTYTLSSGYYDAYYLKALRVRRKIIDDFVKCFKTYDFIIGPTVPTPALPVGSSKTSPMFGELMDKLVEPSSIAGLTGISIPVNLSSSGLPIGIQIIANHFAESSLLAFSSFLEKRINFCDKPII